MHTVHTDMRGVTPWKRRKEWRGLEGSRKRKISAFFFFSPHFHKKFTFRKKQKLKTEEGKENKTCSKVQTGKLSNFLLYTSSTHKETKTCITDNLSSLICVLYNMKECSWKEYLSHSTPSENMTKHFETWKHEHYHHFSETFYTKPINLTKQ